MTSHARSALFLNRQPARARDHPRSQPDEKHHRVVRHLRHRRVSSCGHATSRCPATLQRRLLDRELREPLETCLKAENGVICEDAGRGDARRRWWSATRRWPRCWCRMPRAWWPKAAHVPLHSVAQLLLTAGQASQARFVRPCGAGDGAGRRTDDRAWRQHRRTAHRDAVRAAVRPRRDVRRPARATARPMPIANSTSSAISNSSCTRTSAGCSSDAADELPVTVAQCGGRTPRSPAMARAIRTVCSATACRRWGACSRSPRVRSRCLCVGEGARTCGTISVALRVVPGEFDLGWAGPIADCGAQPARAARAAQPGRRASAVGATRRRPGERTPMRRRTRRRHRIATAEERMVAPPQHLLGRLRKGGTPAVCGAPMP